MPHYKTFYDSKWVKAWDLGGKDITVVIEKVVGGFIEDKSKGTKDRIPILWFRGAKKPFGLTAKCNSDTIASLYTTMTEEWVGKAITLYPTITNVGGKSMDCIRIRPVVPPKGKAVDMPNPLPAEREPGQEG